MSYREIISCSDTNGLLVEFSHSLGRVLPYTFAGVTGKLVDKAVVADNLAYVFGVPPGVIDYLLYE